MIENFLNMNKVYFFFTSVILLQASLSVLIAATNQEDDPSETIMSVDWMEKIEKRPSWVVGRDIDKDNHKRIIEFKKDLEDQIDFIEKYERNLDEIKQILLQQRSKQKRPSIYKPRGIGIIKEN